ncbi:hypothetical protein LguiA_033932 [Lonicera macranthoides]
MHHMECLSEFYANGLSFKQLPDSFVHLKKLTILSLVGCNKSFPDESLPAPSSSGSLVRAPVSRFLPASISSFLYLRRLDLSDCNLSDGDIPVGLWSLSTLQRLGDGPVMTLSPEAIIMNRTNDGEQRYTFPLSYGPHNPGRHSWVCHIPVIYLGYPIRGGEEMEVSFEINHPLEVKQCGIHLVYKPNIEEDDQGQSSGVDGNVDSDGAIVDNRRPKRARIA